MSGIQQAMQASLAGQREWRRVTVATNGGRYGYSFPGGLNMGACNLPVFRGATIGSFYGDTGGSGNMRITFNTAGLPQNFFDCLEIVLASGISRYFRYNDPNVVYGSGGGFTEWDWNPLPNPNYAWSAAELGKTVGFLLS